LILLFLFLAATLVQLFFWSFFFARLAFYRPVPRSTNMEHKPVSIVICARNEAENLRKNLPHFLNQNYRSFEIIVVNDNSSDKTEQVLLEFQQKSPKLRVINLYNPTFPGKKTALSTGIKASKYDFILLSDADCRPRSRQWIRQMQAPIQGEIRIGLGYSPYRDASGWLNRFIRFETVYTATQYLSFALAGIPYMGVGRNLAYHKELFQSTRGFQKHMDLLSGDDDLFVNEVARPFNTSIVLEPGAFTVSEPKHTWRDYYYQKRRHLTTGRRYRPLHQLLLAALSASHAGHYLAGLLLLLSGTCIIPVLLIYLVRIGVVCWLYFSILKKLDARDLWKWVPLLDVAYLLFYFAFAPGLIFGNAKRWK